MIQWHPTILAKLAIIPQRVMLSYPIASGGNIHSGEDLLEDKQKKTQQTKDVNDVKTQYEGAAFAPGDFVVHFEGCKQPEKDCRKEFERFWKMTEDSRGKKGGK